MNYLIDFDRADGQSRRLLFYHVRDDTDDTG